MVTIVRGRIPSEEFVLRSALSEAPEFQFEVERIVETGDDSVMPLVWARGPERDVGREALNNDPTVEAMELLADLGDEWLYRMDWVDHVELLLQMITHSKASILGAHGSGDFWSLRIMFPVHEELSNTLDFCKDHGINFEVESIRELDEEPAGRFGLTSEQFDALTNAAEAGLFKVPRQTTIKELAEKQDISHQALSERIRRATDVLVEETLLIGSQQT
jgi:hypothetical protein